MYQVDNIAALRNNNIVANINVNYYSNQGDGGGGTFFRIGSDCSGGFIHHDDGGIIIQSFDSSNKVVSCYQRQFTGTVHLRWYGVIDDQDITSSCPPRRRRPARQTPTASATWRMLDSSQNPVQEFKDSAHLHLNNTYQDAISAKASGSQPTLAAGINVVSSCSGTCSSTKGVSLPAASSLIDAPMLGATGSACTSAQRCGAAGGITVVNNTGSAMPVWPASGDTVNGASSYPLAINTSKTFFPVYGVGYISN